MARKGTVTIGIAAPLSGEAKLLGREMKQAIELAVDEVNSQGGISGQEILTFALDDQSEVERGQAVAEEFARRPDVLAVIGHYSSDVTIAAADVYHQASLAVVTPIASNPNLTEKRLPNVFRFTNRDDETGLAIAQFLYRELGKRRAVLVESATAYGRSMAQQFGDAFQRIGGEIVYRQIVQSGERSFDGMIRSLLKDFDFVFYGGSFEGAYILRTMRSAGLGQRFAAGDGCWTNRTFWFLPATPCCKEKEFWSFPQLLKLDACLDRVNSLRNTRSALEMERRGNTLLRSNLLDPSVREGAVRAGREPGRQIAGGIAPF